ncbi:uncharacterized protein EV420DRAFT_615210 [Desarmillaria tabescens]|uniref:Uncharacterized protein n=1 Tax=Armillaria tabescens TaxID=1929756 RepID=A0AA39K606_ARMTA|nr:uncharacterized protein EV420DRAFT_615210 [Desarmillaria tabescens]KAK0454001.1 hypothetical protein EV420DRAFT_615210 [Desarmillaria tabescens]
MRPRYKAPAPALRDPLLLPRFLVTPLKATLGLVFLLLQKRTCTSWTQVLYLRLVFDFGVVFSSAGNPRTYYDRQRPFGRLLFPINQLRLERLDSLFSGLALRSLAVLGHAWAMRCLLLGLRMEMITK